MLTKTLERLLPRRAGSKPVDHAITYFDHVRLPPTSILGSILKPDNMRQNFLSTIWRVGVGSLSLSTTCVPCLEISAYIAAKYSLRRKVAAPDGNAVPIIHFRTQQKPILQTFALAAVMKAYAEEAPQWFMNQEYDPPVRHAFATAFKAVQTQVTQSYLFILADRCGSQGLFDHNQIVELQMEARGNSIAEGDVLALCIRTFIK